MVFLLTIFILSLQSSFATSVVAEQRASATFVNGHGDMVAKQAETKRKDSRLVRKADVSEYDEASQEDDQAPPEPQGFDWTPRLPSFIENYPNFYAALFFMTGFAFLGFVCMYVHYEDAKEEERRAIMREIQREAAMSGDTGKPALSQAALQAAAAAAEASLARAPPLTIPAPAGERIATGASKARSTYATYPQPGFLAFRSAMNRMTGLLVGDKKLGSTSGSQETTSASGASSPRSIVSSQVSGGLKSKATGIRNGTVLVARIPEVIFASPTSWQEIGVLAVGQPVHAAGPPQVVEDYTMVPIQPRGAVDMKTLEVLPDE